MEWTGLNQTGPDSTLPLSERFHFPFWRQGAGVQACVVD